MLWPLLFVGVVLFFRWGLVMSPPNLANYVLLISECFLALAVGCLVATIIGYYLPKVRNLVREEYLEPSEKGKFVTRSRLSDGTTAADFYFLEAGEIKHYYLEVPISNIEVRPIRKGRPKFRLEQEKFSHPWFLFFGLPLPGKRFRTFMVPRADYDDYMAEK